jgi:hypothetical protein
MSHAPAARRKGIPPLDVRSQQGGFEIHHVVFVSTADQQDIHGFGHELLMRTVHEPAKPRRLVNKPTGKANGDRHMSVSAGRDDAHAADLTTIVITGQQFIADVCMSDELARLGHKPLHLRGRGAFLPAQLYDIWTGDSLKRPQAGGHGQAAMRSHIGVEPLDM